MRNTDLTMPPLSTYKSNAPFPRRFPFDIEKKILFHTLTIPPYYPSKDVTDQEFSIYALAGQTGRARKASRRQTRMSVQQAALRCMLVCKSWKEEATKYLYAEPYLTSDNLCSFSRALLRGDKRWSDINIHPESTPGRWVTMLDLSNLHAGDISLHSTVLADCCSTIFSLVPYLQHLELPSGSPPASLHEITQAAFAPRLRSLFSLEVDYELVQDRHLRVRSVASDLLRRMPNLEILGLSGPGDALGAESFEQVPDLPKLPLGKLHTLFLQDVMAGLELSSLINAELPSLRRLYITSFQGHIPNLTDRFLQTHGESILSLTYLPIGHSRNPRNTQPPKQTLEWHPNLTHLASFGKIVHILEASPSMTLKHLGLPKPQSTDNSPAVNEIDPMDMALQFLIKSTRKCASLVTLDGFRWVNANLGERAMSTGVSGRMRGWAEKLRAVDVQLRDMDGLPAPPLLTSYGYPSDRSRRRRSSEYQNARTRPERLEEDGA